MASAFVGDILKSLRAIRRNDFLFIIPLVVWLGLFQFAGVIPGDYRPSIDVRTLPYAEAFLFGQSLLYRLIPKNDLLVLMAAVPYLAHFSLPFLFVTYLLKVDGKPFLFLWYFGLLNFTGVMTHMIFPTAPPWYNARFGIEPATYDIPGDPGRLKRADEILEVPLFESIYGNSPLVFGSFPSLHAGWPFLICIYTTIFKLPFLHRFVKWGYVCWVWWAALYLKHHFMLDVLGGAVYALICIYISDKYIVNRFFYCPTETDLEARKKEKDLPADIDEHWEVVDV